MTTTDPTRQLIEHDAGHASPVADCQWCPTTDRRWSEATRELVAETLHADLCPEDPDDGDACMCDIADHDRSAGVALDALAAAGLLADPQELQRLRARVAELERPGRWELPAEPGAEVTTVWDVENVRWARQLPGIDRWVADEHAVWDPVRTWGELLPRGPLSATPPERGNDGV